MAITRIITPAVTDDAVTLAKMAPGTDGNLITYDASGNVNGTENVIDPQGIDQSKLVPLLVKTIQELEARITALEA